jgi:hypothetical protein
MRVNWHINQEMINTQLINIIRINWPSNCEDVKLLDNGQSDHHRGPVRPLASVHSMGSLGGRTVIEVGLTASFCSLSGFTRRSDRHRGQSNC